MSRPGWKVALASVQGTSHISSDTPCQDAARAEIIEVPEGKPVLIAIVSDGAGSARYSHIGSRIACDHFLDCIVAHLTIGNPISTINREMIETWLLAYQYELESIAAESAHKIAEYACTVLVSILGEHQSAFAQIGDGAIVVAADDEPDELCWMYWPQQGEYENVTYFSTSDDAAERLQFDLISRPMDELAMFSDGVQKLALHYQSRTVHTPFLLPKLKVLRKEPPGHLPELSRGLANYLASEPVNSRTDDDKTLILATRRINQSCTVTTGVDGDRDSTHQHDENLL